MTAAFDQNHQRDHGENNGNNTATHGDEDYPTYFDDTDGAYQVNEPDPFAVSAQHRLIAAGPSLRHEIASAPPRPIASLTRPNLPSMQVSPALQPVLPAGLRRGSTLAVTSSVSLLLAVLARPSAQGAWVAMVGMPAISADAVAEAGIDLSRLAIISTPEGGWSAPSWTTAVGALLDAVDIVVARPGITAAAYRSRTDNVSSAQLADGDARHLQLADGDARRLNARTRAKEAVLVLFGQQAASWPSVEVQLDAQHGKWSGISNGHGRITARQLVVSASGRGRSAQPRTAELWLPAASTTLSTTAPPAIWPAHGHPIQPSDSALLSEAG